MESSHKGVGLRQEDEQVAHFCGSPCHAFEILQVKGLVEYQIQSEVVMLRGCV